MPQYCEDPSSWPVKVICAGKTARSGFRSSGEAPQCVRGERMFDAARDDLPPTPPRRAPGSRYLKTEVSISREVMNSSSAGTPSSVFRIARFIAGMISPGSLTRSPYPPSACANAA